MNYEKYLTHEYNYYAPTLQTGNSACVCFFGDGSYVSFRYDMENDDLDDILEYSIEESLSYIVSYCNSNYRDRGNLIACNVFSYPNGVAYQSHLFLTSRLDYCVIGGSYTYLGARMSQQTNYLGDLDDIDNYYLGNTSNFSNYNYGRYAGQLSQTKSVFDLTNLNYSNDVSYFQDTILLDDVYTSFYRSLVFSTYYNTSQPSCYFAYGTPYSDIREATYQNGYSEGYALGNATGFDSGYEAGISMGGVGNETAHAFTYIGSAFNTVSNILSLEVLPNVTLGLCFSIPLVLVLIMTIFRLVKK